MRFYANPTAALNGLVHLMLEDHEINRLGGKGVTIALKPLDNNQYALIADPQGTARPRKKKGGYWGMYFGGFQWPATGRTTLAYDVTPNGFILKPYESERVEIKTKMGRKKAVTAEETPIAAYQLDPTIEQLKQLLQQVNDLLTQLPNVEAYISDRRVRARVTTVVEL